MNTTNKRSLEFSKTRLGQTLEFCILQYHSAKVLMKKNKDNVSRYIDFQNLLKIEEAKLEVFKVAIEEIYGINCELIETDEHLIFGKTEEDWLIQIKKWI